MSREVRNSMTFLSWKSLRWLHLPLGHVSSSYVWSYHTSQPKSLIGQRSDLKATLLIKLQDILGRLGLHNIFKVLCIYNIAVYLQDLLTDDSYTFYSHVSHVLALNWFYCRTQYKS